MEKTLDLVHNGKRAYALDGKRFVCHDALKESKKKSYQIRLTASTVTPHGQSEQIEVTKTSSGWTWPAPNMKYPLVIYSGGQEVLNTFFPSAQNGVTKTIWLKFTVLKEHKEKE